MGSAVVGDVVVIGVDPHKATVTLEARDTRGVLRASGTFPTSKVGYAAMVRLARQWPARVWAVEGARGVGRALVARLVADRERVLDVPAKLAAQVRVFDQGHGRKTDAHDAHAIVLVALRDPRLHEVASDPDLEMRRLLVDRREVASRMRSCDALGSTSTSTYRGEGAWTLLVCRSCGAQRGLSRLIHLGARREEGATPPTARRPDRRSALGVVTACRGS